MSYILTAVYAAGAGNNTAASYAAGLASAVGLPLRIIYPYVVPVALGEMPMPLLPVEEVREAAMGRLTAAEKMLQSQYPALPISSDAAYGTLEDLLDEACERDAPLLTVIGNDEEGADSGGWIGSAGADILRNGGWPVLAVPGSASFARPQHICLACDAQSIRDGVPAASLLQLQSVLGFRITVLHVLGAGEEVTVTFKGSALEKSLASAAMEVRYVEISGEGAVDEAIAAFADSHGIDWLALAPHHYGFWEGLFHKSHTSHLLRLAHVPVLGLHA